MTTKNELTHRFRPIWRVDATSNLTERCEDLLRRMRSIWHKTQAPVFLFADDEGGVYLIGGDNPAGDRMAASDNRYFVGSYGVHAVFPSVEQMREDLIAHFCSIDYITEKMIRDAIVDAEG